MNIHEAGIQTQIKNIEAQLGFDLLTLDKKIEARGPMTYATKRDWLKQEFGLSHVYADTAILSIEQIKKEAKGPLSDDDIVNEMYSGPKEALKPIHLAFMNRLKNVGAFELAPKKGYVSLRTHKQFCQIGPATNSRVEVGLNIKTLEPHERLIEMPAGSICNFKVKITAEHEVDDQLMAWVTQAYKGAQK